MRVNPSFARLRQPAGWIQARPLEQLTGVLSALVAVGSSGSVSSEFFAASLRYAPRSGAQRAANAPRGSANVAGTQLIGGWRDRVPR